jgi:hypothetical protein
MDQDGRPQQAEQAQPAGPTLLTPGPAVVEDIENAFRFHPATPVTGPQHDAVRTLMRGTAVALVQLVPESVEQHVALERLREAMYWANAGIACHPDLLDPVDNPVDSHADHRAETAVGGESQETRR